MLKTSPAFVEVFVASMIDLLQRGRPVHLPGVGTWRVEHASAHISIRGDDQPSAPPEDRIIFTADPS